MGFDTNKYAGASKWLKAKDITDLDMDAVIVTICEVYEEAFEARDGKAAEDRLCIRFKEFEKPLGLNVTNTKSLIEILGDDTDAWDGRKVKLRIGTANNPQTGVSGDCIRIVAPPAKAKPGAPVAAAAAAKPKPRPAQEEDETDPYADQ